MDNKITKKRLFNMLSYEWLAIVAVSIACILFCHFLFNAIAVKPAEGQAQKIYFDENLSTTQSNHTKDFLKLIEEDTFSSQVKKIERENLIHGNNALSARLGIGEGTAIFTDKITDKLLNYSRAEHVVDNFNVYSFEELRLRTKEYLVGFLKDEFSNKKDQEKLLLALDFENLSEKKIEENFNARTKGKRSYQNDIRKGLLTFNDELERIEKLCKDASAFEKLFEIKNNEYVHEQLFYRYTKFYKLKDSVEGNKQIYIDAYEKEIVENRENAIYGINVEFLTGGQLNVGDYFRITGEKDAKEVVLLAFDFGNERKDMQFEAVSFIVKILKEYSSII